MKLLYCHFAKKKVDVSIEAKQRNFYELITSSFNCFFTDLFQNLLSLGSSPHYTDDKGLTPLYHAAIMGDDVSVSEALLKYRAVIGQTDHIGWTELHQVSWPSLCHCF